jgi:hypothetical protein
LALVGSSADTRKGDSKPIGVAKVRESWHKGFAIPIVVAPSLKWFDTTVLALQPRLGSNLTSDAVI